MKKRHYQQPMIRIVALQQRQQMLGISQTSPSRPSASFMSNPGIGDEDDDD